MKTKYSRQLQLICVKLQSACFSDVNCEHLVCFHVSMLMLIPVFIFTFYTRTVGVLRPFHFLLTSTGGAVEHPLPLAPEVAPHLIMFALQSAGLSLSELCHWKQLLRGLNQDGKPKTKTHERRSVYEMIICDEMHTVQTSRPSDPRRAFVPDTERSTWFQNVF